MRNTDRVGDVAAKQEAVKMIRESMAFAEMPTEVAELATPEDTEKETPKASSAAKSTAEEEPVTEAASKEEDEEEELIAVEG
ncbi:MAG: hypothetical protein SGARI_006929 [Bacillariaceae sp.]